MIGFRYDQRAWDRLATDVERIAPGPRWILGTLGSVLALAVLPVYLSEGVLHLWWIAILGGAQVIAWSGKYDLNRQAKMNREIAILQADGERLALEVARMKKRGENPIQFMIDEGLSFVQTRSLVLRWAKELTREGRV